MAQPESGKDGGPTALVAAAVKNARKNKGWSAQRLADEMRAVGIEWERTIVVNLETGRRRFVTAEELLALAYVLDWPPAALILGTEPASVAQLGDQPYPVTPLVFVDTNVVVEWLTGFSNFYGLGLRHWLAVGEEGREAARRRAFAAFDEVEDSDQVARIGDVFRILREWLDRTQSAPRPGEEPGDDQPRGDGGGGAR